MRGLGFSLGGLPEVPYTITIEGIKDQVFINPTYTSTQAANGVPKEGARQSGEAPT